MTWLDVILYGPGWAACAWLPVDWWLEYRSRQRNRSFPVNNGGGVITFPRRMSDAEVAEFKARWRETYGKPGTPPRGPAGASSANPKPTKDEEEPRA